MNDLSAEGETGRSADRMVPLALAGICAVGMMIAFVCAQAAGVDALRPDTASYMYFDPSRSIGYPAFLWVIRAATGDVLAAVPAQMALLAASLFLLGWSFYKLTSHAALAIAFQLLTLCSPEVWKNAMSLITEGIATTCVALWCALLLLIVRKPSLKAMALLSLVSTFGVLVRPSLIPLLLGAVVAGAVLVPRQRRWPASAMVVAAMAGAFATTPVANVLIHGSPASGSPVARGILQHAMYCELGKTPTDADAAFVEHHASVVRRYIRSAPVDVQPTLKQLYSGELRFGLIIPVIGHRHGLDAGWQTDRIVMRVATERVAANPLCYGKSALSSYYRMATYETAPPGRIERLRSFLATHTPVVVPLAPLLPNEERLAILAAREAGATKPARPGTRLLEAPMKKPLVLILGARALHIGASLAGLFGMLALAVGLYRRHSLARRLVALGALGSVYHGVIAITALVELPMMRYTVPVWPVVCTLLGVAGIAIFEKISATQWLKLRTSRYREPASSGAGSDFY